MGVIAAMLLVEVIFGLYAGSLSLMADVVDFADDALKYAILKAVSMMGFGLYVLGVAL